MNIFNTTKELTQAQKLKEFISSIKQSNKVALDMLKKSHEINFNNIWNNPSFTPQEIFDEFGTDAVQLFQVSSATQEFIKMCDPDYEILVPPVEFTINEDGTVTVTE